MRRCLNSRFNRIGSERGPEGDEMAKRPLNPHSFNIYIALRLRRKRQRRRRNSLSQVPRRETLGSTRVLGAGALVDRALRFIANYFLTLADSPKSKAQQNSNYRCGEPHHGCLF